MGRELQLPGRLRLLAQPRPWLTVVLDDCSRAIAGFTVFLGAPSAVNPSLALRQAIWRKTDSGWAVHGLPDVLYADHGSDFTSDHSDTGLAPQHAWLAAGWLPRTPDRLEQLDLLLVQVAAPRMVHRDGIRFLCRAISREHAGQALTLKRHLPLQVTERLCCQNTVSSTSLRPRRVFHCTVSASATSRTATRY